MIAGGWPAKVVPLLVDSGAKSTGVLVVIALVAAAWRRAPAAARHFLWLAAVLSLPVIPFFSTILPKWCPLSQSDQATLAKFTARLAPSVEESTKPQPFAGANPVSSNSNPGAPSRANDGIQPREFFTWIAWIWLGGVATILVTLLLSVAALSRLEKRSVRLIEGPWLDMLRESCRSIGNRRAVMLLKAPCSRMPMAWGVFHPKVLLPESAALWPVQRLRAVLLHEAAHLRRGDCLANLAVQCVCALYWPNPLVWFAAHRMLVERERACDDIVLKSGIEPSCYAESVVEIAANLPVGKLSARAALPMARPSSFERRVLSILDRKRPRQGLSRVLATSMMAGCAGLIVPLSMISIGDNRSFAMASTSALHRFENNSPSASLTQRLQYSPMIERVLPLDAKDHGTHFLNFQTGEIILLPPEPKDADGRTLNDWIAHDVAVGEESHEGLALEGHGCVFRRIESERWYTIPAETALAELLDDGDVDRVPVPRAGVDPALFLFKAQDGAAGLVKVVRSPDASHDVQICYRLIQSAPHLATGSRWNSDPLINIDFCHGEESPESGAAAIGWSASDFWNAYNCYGTDGLQRADGSALGLRLADRTPTEVWIAVTNAPGDWANGSDDIMYRGYMYAPYGQTVTITVHGLESGSYDFYIYGHDCNDLIEAGGKAYPANGAARSFEWPVVNPVIWEEGRQYVAIRGVSVTPTQNVILIANPGRQGYAVMAGMQIARVK
jgi:beta-lactamase regulating signal transducer with metallopeptidase domain